MFTSQTYEMAAQTVAEMLSHYDGLDVYPGYPIGMVTATVDGKFRSVIAFRIGERKPDGIIAAMKKPVEYMGAVVGEREWRPSHNTLVEIDWKNRTAEFTRRSDNGRWTWEEFIVEMKVPGIENPFELPVGYMTLSNNIRLACTDVDINGRVFKAPHYKLDIDQMREYVTAAWSYHKLAEEKPEDE